MDDTILTLLDSDERANRRRGIAAAARSGDRGYIPVLIDHFKHEHDDELKSLFRSAALNLRDHDPSQPARKPAPSRARKLIPFLIFTAVVVAIGAGVVWTVAGPILRARWTTEHWNTVFASATTLPTSPLSANQPLNGAVYTTRVSALTTYDVVEPVGTSGSNGWSILVVLHGWMGSGRGDIPAYADDAARSGVILVAPTFDHASNPSYEMVYRDLREILRQLKVDYVVDQRASVLTGFSWGGRVTEFYSVHYPQDYGGAVLGGSREYLPVPSESQVRYAVFIGSDDFLDNVNRPQLAKDFAATMEQAGKPLWYFEVVPGVGHARVQRQVDKTFELIDLLRNEAH